MQDKGLIAVAMSGGVDSSVTAAMLKRAGHSIVGMTMQLWNQRRLPKLVEGGVAGGRCCSLDDVYDARRVANHVGAPFYVVNLEDEFEKQVVRPFVDEYLSGRTPIPCTLCNNFIKFDQFLELADGVGAEKIATGHYARVEYDAETGRYLLRKGVDDSRDQTYFLCGLTQPMLARTLFPIGGLRKTEIRAMAREWELPVAEKGESHEICFVPNGDYAEFIREYQREQGAAAPDLAGELVTADGQVIGEHEGVHHFTVGQRRGLGVAAGQPLYVIQTDPVSRRVTIGPNDLLLRSRLVAKDVNWISIAGLSGPRRAEVKIRYKHQAAPATLSPLEDGRVEVRFDEPQRAITPGQGTVFYEGNLVLGGGWIAG